MNRFFKQKLRKLVAFLQNEVIKSRNPTSSTVIQIVEENVVADAANFVTENLTNAMIFEDREKLWKYAIDLWRTKNEKEEVSRICFLEFGVFKGESLRYFAQNIPGSQVCGFDSFEGLIEDWTGMNRQRGFFNLHGSIPKFQEGNVKLIVGRFEDTLEQFIYENKENLSDQIIVHIDCDTYTPAKYVLENLKNLEVEMLLIFDEFMGYPNWRNHEFKALMTTFNRETLDFLGFTNSQALVKVKPLVCTT